MLIFVFFWDKLRIRGSFSRKSAEYNARVRVWSYVRLGMIHDVQNEREQAVELYCTALAVESGESVAKVEARQYLKTPYSLASRS